MPRYAISHEGVEALRALANSLNTAVVAIGEATNELFHEIESDEDGLGVYAHEIYLLLQEIARSDAAARDSVEYLSRDTLQRRIQKIEELLAMGLCSDDDSSDDPAPKVRKRTLHR